MVLYIDGSHVHKERQIVSKKNNSSLPLFAPNSKQRKLLYMYIFFARCSLVINGFCLLLKLNSCQVIPSKTGSSFKVTLHYTHYVRKKKNHASNIISKQDKQNEHESFNGMCQQLHCASYCVAVWNGTDYTYVQGWLWALHQLVWFLRYLTYRAQL